MFKRLKQFYIKLLLLRASNINASKIYRKYFGVNIGNNVRLTDKYPNFGSEPYLIEIGDNVTITNNVVFSTHDGGVGIFRNEFPGMNVFGRIKIGSNVFIGSRTNILPGITIGDNVVIGAGSVITRDVPSNVVVAGIPAKVIKSIDDYKKESLNKAIFVTEKSKSKRKQIILDSFVEKA